MTRAVVGGETGDLAVRVGGSIHGFVFLAYGATAVLTAINQRWGVGVGLLAVVTAVIPYATVPVRRLGAPLGPARRRLAARGDGRPAGRRLVRPTGAVDAPPPVPPGGALLGAVVVIFVVLLQLGPPVPKG